MNTKESTPDEPTKPWREENGVIYFSVTSDGTTGKEWIKRLKRKRFGVTKEARMLLLSPNFKPTSGVTTEIAVLKGTLFEGEIRTTGQIRAEAKRRNLTEPNAEVACLIREKFTDKEIEAMGLWYIVAMHVPIEGPDNLPYLLRANRSVHGSFLLVGRGMLFDGWRKEGGFAFSIPQVQSSTPTSPRGFFIKVAVVDRVCLCSRSKTRSVDIL